MDTDLFERIIRRFKFAVYIAIAVVGLVFLALSGGTQTDALLNIGAELFGGALVSAVLLYLLLDGSPDDSSRNCFIGVRGNKNQKSDFVEMIESAKEEICVSGISLFRIADPDFNFDQHARSSVKSIRFLAVDPDNAELIEEISRYLGETETVGFQKVRSSLERLSRLTTSTRKVEVKVTKYRPSVGYFMTDPHRARGTMAIGPYIYKNSGNDTPLVRLSARTNGEEYDIFLESFEKLWNEATEWPPKSENQRRSEGAKTL
jgi:hypothetical protein